MAPQSSNANYSPAKKIHTANKHTGLSNYPSLELATFLEAQLEALKQNFAENKDVTTFYILLLSLYDFL